jgi:hypothetical protein
MRSEANTLGERNESGSYWRKALACRHETIDEFRANHYFFPSVAGGADRSRRAAIQRR